ncbi:hypothetical protein ACIPSA_44685 [Streptomyces sp. NPDC086549]
MKQIAKRTALAATNAFAINQVDCGRSDFVQVTSHQPSTPDAVPPVLI